MCGITGIYNRNLEPVSSKILERMNQRITHRGPDGDGVWTDGSVGLGHTRLAIIDLSPMGHQPMMSRDGRYVITYNGEVYNFRELRVELESLGYPFHSKTDTEVVMNAFAEWGVQALSKMNGMFAFAIWDQKERLLYLARDRYGIKPLYYCFAGDQFIFASEVKAILEHPSVSVEVDKSALVEYFTFQNTLTEKTLFKNIHIMPAGNVLTIQEKTHSQIQFWDFNFFEPNNSISREDCVEELDRLFNQAVNRQLVSDVEIGAYLSGGMDSAAITAISSMQLPYIKTFTCGFDVSSISGIEQTFDERGDAEHMSYVFKTEHYEMVLKAGDMERCMSALAYHIEEPRVGQSYPNFYVSRLASKFGKVVLAGTAGDEIFAGYPWRYYPCAVSQDFNHYLENYYRYWERIFSCQEHEKAFSPIWDDVRDVSTFDIFKSVFNRQKMSTDPTPEEYINHSLYYEAKTFLHGLLVIEDKLSMAHSIETRVPFLDNDLVDFAQKIPVRYKLGCLDEVVRANLKGESISQYLQKTRDGKMILRDMMRKYLPIEVVEKVKQGFSAPDASWFQGESMQYVKKVIFNQHSRIYDFLDKDFIQTKVMEHLDGKVNHRLLIWSLLSFEHWCSQYLS
jgi:asparagine synthase (glutamine-hydrolysing)